MITQELAKQLYNIGFTQITAYQKHDFEITEAYEGNQFRGDLYKCKLCNKEHLCSTGINIGPSCTHTSDFNIGCPNAEIKYGNLPTLSELIEACGRDFDRIELNKDYVHPEYDKWTCDGLVRIKPNHQTTLRFEGKTPEEAVAKLWLELNKKNE